MTIQVHVESIETVAKLNYLRDLLVCGGLDKYDPSLYEKEAELTNNDYVLTTEEVDEMISAIFKFK